MGTEILSKLSGRTKNPSSMRALRGMSISILPALLLIFAVNNSSLAQNIEIKDGVKYVSNDNFTPSADKKISLRFIRKVEGVDGKQENLPFNQPGDYFYFGNGENYVLDYKNHRIQVFDSGWEYLRTAARLDEERTAFPGFYNLEMSGEGLFFAAPTFISNRIQILSNDGEYLRSIRSPVRLTRFAVMNSGEILILNPFKILDPGSESENLFIILDYNRYKIREFGKAYDYNTGNDLVFMTGNQLYFTIDKEDNIYTSFMFQNRIEKYNSDGDLKLMIDRSLNIEGVNEYELIDLKSSYMPDSTKKYPEFPNVSNGIALDNKDRIWVRTFKKQISNKDEPAVEVMEFEVFDKDGVLENKIPLPVNFQKFKIYGSKLYLIDYRDQMCIYVYEIVEG
ncbi:hypothetical protein ACFL6O_05705 [candidate division KSB1 bacterium]